MPEITPPPYLDDVQLDAPDRKYDLEMDLVNQAEALSLVTKTFGHYEMYRDRDHLVRWENHENLYYGRVKQQYWPGSKKKKAALGIPIVFEQEESVIPALESALFTQYPYWFTAEAIEGVSTVEDAQQRQARLAYWFETPREADGRTVTDQLSLAIQQIVHHGNGVVQVGWDPNGYFCDWRDIRDIYVDPRLKTPWLDDSAAIIDYQRIKINDLKRMAESHGLKLPNDAVLNFLAKNKAVTGGDQARAVAEAYRMAQYDPGILHPDPAKQDIDVLIYWTDRRVIWVLGKAWVALQVENEYGFKPFCGGLFIPSLQSWYSAGLGDFVEGEQRLMQGLTNTHLNELQLAMDPVRTRKRGAYTHPSGLSYRPGLVDQVDKPKDDVIYQFPSGVTKEYYVEMEMAERRAQKRMGVSDIGMGGGAARPAATRTAAGVQLQTAGASNRLYMAVKRIERFLLTPLLYKTSALMDKFDQEQSPIGRHATPQGMNSVAVNPAAMKRQTTFRLNAATKALSRDSMRAALPIVLQTYTQGPLVQGLAKVNKTVDFIQIDRFVEQALGTSGNFQFVKDMTPEEIQAMQQPPPEVMMKMQAQQQQQQTQVQLAQQKLQGDMNLQAEKSAIEVLKIIATDQQIDKELRQKALEAVAKLNSKGGEGGE